MENRFSDIVGLNPQVSDELYDAAFRGATTQGSAPIVLSITVPDGAGDTSIVVPFKFRAIDIWAVKTVTAGGVGDTVTVKNNTVAVSSAIVLNVADKTLARTTTLDDATTDFAAGATLTCTAANGTDNSCIVYVMGIEIA